MFESLIDRKLLIVLKRLAADAKQLARAKTKRRTVRLSISNYYLTAQRLAHTPVIDLSKVSISRADLAHLGLFSGSFPKSFFGSSRRKEAGREGS